MRLSPSGNGLKPDVSTLPYCSIKKWFVICSGTCDYFPSATGVEMAQACSSAGKGDKDKCRHSANLYNRKTSRYYERSLVSLYDLKYICAKQVKIPTQQSNLSNKQQAEEEITPHNSFRQLIASWTIDVSDKSHERRITEHLPPEPNQDLNPTTSTSQTLHSKLTRGFFCVHLKTPLLLRG